MENWGFVELYSKARMAEAGLPRKSRPIPPETSSLWCRSRRALAEALVRLGVHLDARASRAAVGTFEATPHLNGSDA